MVGSAVVFRSVPVVVGLVLARVGFLLASGDRRDAEILALHHQRDCRGRPSMTQTEPSLACCPRCSIATVSLRSS